MLDDFNRGARLDAAGMDSFFKRAFDDLFVGGLAGLIAHTGDGAYYFTGTKFPFHGMLHTTVCNIPYPVLIIKILKVLAIGFMNSSP